ncbi:MAG: DUF4290 domain-containing protein [Cyclobacteriaceae bacterium]
MIGEYNSQRPHIILKEYGRNVQRIVDYIRTVPDKEKRTQLAYTLIELIRQLMPAIKDDPENPQRIWDDLYIIADFNLDINNPYPVPNPEVVFRRPKRMSYPQVEVRFKHYGKNIESLVKEAMKKQDPAEREEAVIYLGKLMKTFYANWNKEPLDDSVILRDIRNMSGGILTMNLDKVREDNLFEKLYREKKVQRPQGNGGGGGGQRHQHGRSGKPFKRHNNPHRRRDQ